MGTEKSTDFHFLVLGFLFKSTFWVLGLLCNSLFFVFGAVEGWFSNSRVEESEKIEPSSGLDSGDVGFGKIETLDMDFAFRGDSGGVSDESEAERESSVLSDHAATTMTSKYQFVSGKNISGYVEEPRIMSLTVQEMFVGPTDPAGGIVRVPEKQFSGKSSFETEDSVLSFSFGMAPEKIEKVRVADFKNDELGKLDFSGEARFDSEIDVLPEPDSTGSDFDLGSCENVTEASGFEIEGEIEDFENDELGKLDFSGEAQFDSKRNFLPESDSISTEYDLGSCENVAEDFGFEIDLDPIVAGDGSDDDMEEDTDPIVARDVSGEDSGEEIEAMIGSEKGEGQGCFDDFEDDVGWDLISEHRDLIEQLKIELKNVRIGGLPTILEESESPKIVEDLKPLKINEKRLEHKDRVEEIQKVYKNYAEKMKKLDVLNYQTVHAIGFIRRKDQSQFIPIRKPTAMKLPFLKNKPRSIRDDPIGDLERDLELVYVGQACLSWKILHWQYEKAKDLSDHDPQGFRHYNEVAGEFQLFQVLVQRYVEDETFQGPRLHNYVKNRCIIRNLLQVPVIKDDKDKKGHKGDESAIPIAMLKQIIHQCMHVFWAFLRADKKGTNMIGSQLFQAELQNPSDKTLYMEVQTDLQKKEKKLKDITRTGNCIVKKFQKQNQEARLHHELFIAQVELRLVSRVLNMSRLSTQQLVWCHEQLGKINFIGRRVCLEPSFLLFPC